MPITVGVCDDNPQQVGLLIQYLNSNHRADKLDIVKSTDPEKFLELVMDKKPQIVFLDIDMGKTNGIRLGGKIKALYKDTVIVYITAYEKYALEAFDVRAFHYLLKPVTRDKFNEVLEESIGHIENDRDKVKKIFTLKTKKEVICLNFGDIIFFEKMGHKIKIHTKEHDFYYYDNFSNLLHTIGADFFIRCHQGYIVNISMIRGFRDKTLFLSENIQLPVSRSYIDAVKKMLAERLFAGKDEK